MKIRIYLVPLSLIIFFLSPVSPAAADAFDGRILAGKIGTAYAENAGKFGLNVSGSYLFDIDKYFTAGPEVELFWLRWERTVGQKEFSHISASKVAKTDAFIIPAFFNAQVRLPGLLEDINIVPSFTVGLGWSTMTLRNSIPGEDNKITFYHGFSWQVYASGEFQPEDSKISFLADMGYRSISPSRGSIKFDMSGFVLRTGVRIPL